MRDIQPLLRVVWLLQAFWFGAFVQHMSAPAGNVARGVAGVVALTLCLVAWWLHRRHS